jgi:hypothetical protein
VNAGNDKIQFASTHHFQEGDILTYSSDLTSDTSGLVDGGRYRVTVIDSYTIQLSDSRIIDSLAVSASVSVAASSSFAVSVAAAGAVAHNTIGGGFEASVVSSDVDATGNVNVLAQDSSAIQSMLFSVSVSVAASGSAAVGIAVSLTEATNTIDGSTLATVADSAVDSTAGAVTVDALSDVGIQAFAISAAIAAGGSGGVSVQGAGTGVIAFNTTTSSIESSIVRSNVKAAGNIMVSARDQSHILAALGAASIAAGGSGSVSINVSISATYAENTIGGSLLATIDNSTVDSTGGEVIVNALADDTIEAFGLAVSVSAGGSGGVSVNVALSAVAATNTIGNAVEASIVDSTIGEINEPTSVSVSALDVSDIFAVLASASVAAGGAGAVSVNVAGAFVYASNALSSTIDFDWNGDGGIDFHDVHAGRATLNRLYELQAGEDRILGDLPGDDGELGTGDDVTTGADDLTADQAIDAYIAENSGVGYLTALKPLVGTSFDINGDGNIDDRDLLLTGGTSDDVVISNSMVATIESSTIYTSGKTNVFASNYDSVSADGMSIKAIGIALGIAAGGAGGVSVNVSGAGVIAFNEISSGIEASIIGSTVTADGDVTVEAVDRAHILSELLAVTLSAGGAYAVSVNVAVSVTYAENTIGGSLLATIDNSTVNSTGGAVIVDAFVDNTIEAFGQAVGLAFGGAAGASFNVALAGVGATNTTTNSVEASIKGGSDVDAMHATNGKVTVSATDLSDIFAVLTSASVAAGGAGGFSLNIAGAGVYANNSIGGTLLATIDSSEVETTGLVTVSSSNYDSGLADGMGIEAIGVAVGVSGGGAGGVSVNISVAGVIAFNTITNVIEASIIGSMVTAGGDVTVEAEDRAHILSELLAITLTVGGAGAASVNVGISVTYAENSMGGSLLATIDNSTVNSTSGAVTVEAFADNTIEAFGQAVGLAFGGAGGASFNVAMAGVGATNTTTNSVEASIKGGSNVDAMHATNGEITVSALDLSDIFAVLTSTSVAAGGAGGFSLNIAGAGVYANNSIGGSLLATIDSSQVNTAGTVSVSASNYDSGLADGMSITATGVAVGVSGGGAGAVSINISVAGVVAFNTITNNIEASIIGSTVNAGGDMWKPFSKML